MFIRFADSINPITRKLANLMLIKSSNLAFSADITSFKKLLLVVKSVADNIVILKIHVDIIEDFSLQYIRELKYIANQAGFLIFEDRKFADIGSIVRHQVRYGMYRIAEWADIINAHMLTGPSVIDGLQSSCNGFNIGLLLIAQMSTENNLFNHVYTDNVVKCSYNYKNFVMGFIGQKKLTNDNHFITMTPGVNFLASCGTFYQCYNSPEKIICKNKSDIVIVGKGIYSAKNPATVSRDYRIQSWNYFCDMMSYSGI